MRADTASKQAVFDGLGIPYRSIPDLLNARCDRLGDSPFLIWEPSDGVARVFSYREFGALVERESRRLADRGVTAGVRIVMHSDNCPEALVFLFACLTLGGVVITTNTKLTGLELAYCIEDSKASLAAVQRDHESMLAQSGVAAQDVVMLSSGMLEHDSSGTPGGGGRIVGPAPLDLAVVQYTSGTSGKPKGVCLTHANLLYGACASAMNEGLTVADIHLIHLPLYHINALCYSLLATLWAGATATLMPRFSVRRFWDVAIKHRCTWAAMIAHSIASLYDVPVPATHCFRRWGWGRYDRSVESRFRVQTIPWYGLTEVITPAAIGELRNGRNIDGSMGRPNGWIEIKLVAQPFSRDENEGELRIFGTPGVTLFDGYLGNEVATAAAFDEDGWFKTGDSARWLENGYLEYGGRLKDLIRVGGEMVSPVEVETVLKTIPGVTDAGVVGVAHPVLGEVPFAVVIGRVDTELSVLAERIFAQCDTQLASFKRPRTVIFAKDLPRVTLAKVDRRALAVLVQQSSGEDENRFDRLLSAKRG
ncbi:UNVERIFIED_ORG: crotonobetaine/carnitine-CoA ligase [Burkholderia contaminans]|nr:crotonobetaine/carnitine-CoA ligase [Burkholderia contaminans]